MNRPADVVERPLVSIVLPTFNHCRFLPSAVESILAQSMADFELIIVNDGSTDGTASYLETVRDSRVRVIHQENRRLPGALNAGFAAARGAFLTWTSDDNLLLPDFLRVHTGALRADPGAVMSVSAFAWIDADGNVLREHRPGRLSYPSVLCVNPGIASFLYRREAAAAAGEYDPGLEGAEDWDMWLRLLEQGRALYIPDILYHYREHEASMTARKRELVQASSRQAFLKAVHRIGGLEDLTKIYPWISRCEDPDGATLDASLDLGIGLLRSPYADAAVTLAVLRRAYVHDGDNPVVAAALAVAADRAGYRGQARALANSFRASGVPVLSALADRLEGADGTTPVEIPPFVLNLEDSELMRQERLLHTGSGDRPLLSVVITTFNRPQMLERCLRSFGEQTLARPLFEVIVVDDGSEPPVRALVEELTAVCPATCIVQPNAGLAAARNAGISAARGEIIVPFDDDNIAAPDYLERTLEFHRRFPDPADAMLGSIRWAPGLEVTPVMHHATVVDARLWTSTGVPDAEVLPFGFLWGGCSSYKKDLIKRAGGFNPAFTFGYEDTEAEWRMVRCGLRVRFNRSAVIYAAAQVSHQELCTRSQRQGRSLRRFQNMYAGDKAVQEYISAQLGPGGSEVLPERQLEQIREVLPHLLSRGWNLPAEGSNEDPSSLAMLYRLLTMLYRHFLVTGMTETEPDRERRKGTQKILVIAPELPAPDRSAGGKRLFDILRLLRADGHAVTFIGRGPIDGVDLLPYVRMLRALGIETYPLDPDRIRETWGITVDHPRVDLEELLRNGGFDSAMLCFYEIARQYLPLIRRFSPGTRVFVDSVDLHFIRELRQAELAGDPQLHEQARRTKEAELEIYRQSDAVIVVSEDDARILGAHQAGLTIPIVPIIYETSPDSPPWGKRRDLLFAGGFRHRPNVDAVLHFSRNIWPSVADRLPGVRWFIVGNQPPPEICALAGERVIVTGYVPEMKQYLDRCRVSIAPLRFGSGMKGKVGEAMAAGLPVVTTPIGREGTGGIPGAHLALAESDTAFAADVIGLYTDEVRWRLMSEQGKDFVDRHYSPAAVGKALRHLFGPPGGDLGAEDTADDMTVAGFGSQENHDVWIRNTGTLLQERHAATPVLPQDHLPFTIGGACGVCGSTDGFVADDSFGWEENGRHVINWRETLLCRRCGLNNRMRASIELLERLVRPDRQSTVYITERRGTRFALLASRYPGMVGSEYLGPGVRPGTSTADGIRHEDLTALTFPDASFELVLSFDVLEHVHDATRALSECYRVLKPGGRILFTVPFSPAREHTLIRATLEGGEVRHLLPPEYHGDPIRDGGALAYYSFGWDLLEKLRAAGFDRVSAYHYWSRRRGYLGDDQMVFVAARPIAVSAQDPVTQGHTGVIGNTFDFSIIVPAHNNRELTGRCLDAIETCGMDSRYEIIVVDNGSDDGLAGVLLGRSDVVKLVRNERNESFSKANNLGAAQARGRYLIFLNNDTQVLPGWMEAIERTFSAEPSIGIQGGKLLYPDGRVQHAGIVYGPVTSDGTLLHYHLHLLHDRNAAYVNRPREFQMVTGALLAIRRELFDLVGGFDERYYFGHEDLDLCMKVRGRGYKVWYTPEASAIHFESVTKKLIGVEKFERCITHPNSYDAANDRLFHSLWDGVLQADADRYYHEDGVPSPFAPTAAARPMRILLTMFGWNESGGGTTFPRAVARVLAHRGHRVSVFFAAGRHPSTKEPYFLERLEEEGVMLYGLYNRGSAFLDADHPEREISDPQAVARFRDVLAQERPELVHLHTLLGLSFAVARAAKETGVPVVYTPHNYHLIDPMLYMIGQDLRPWEGINFWKNSPLPRVLPELATAYRRRVEAAREMLQRDIDCTMAVSSRVRDLLVQFGLPAERALVVHQVHNTVDRLTAVGRPGRKHSLPVRFGYLGGVMPHKGVHLIARAAQRLPEGAATFAIYGFVSDEYRQTLEEADPRKALVLHGEYSENDLPAIAQTVDVMILPSLWEDCAPFAITEALAMGCPVICPDTGGFPDFVRDDWNGRLFPPGDAGALERILAGILADPGVIDRWQQHTALPLSFADHVEHVERLYRGLVKGETVQPVKDDLMFFSGGGNPPDARRHNHPDTGMNRRRLEKDAAGGFANADATGVLPDPLPSPLYLNLGCGRDVRRGFVNIDLFSDDPSVVRMDIRALTLPNGCVDGLVAHDVLEHFSHREIDAVLREWARVLKPGGEFMIRCPSLALQCRAFVNGVWDADVASFMIFGGQTNPGDYHCTGFDRTSITRHLEHAGLSIASVVEEDTPQDKGFINLNMTVKGRKSRNAAQAEPTSEADGRTTSPVRVVWEGEQFARHSLAVVNREICSRLAGRTELELTLEGAGDPRGSTHHGTEILRTRSAAAPSGTANVHVRHLWPAVLEPPPAGHWVVIQPWEYGSLPRSWVEAYQDRVDEFWVPSSYVRDCYVQSGIPGERVVVIPNGVDGSVFRPGVRPLPLATKKKFRFLFVGGTLHRKGFDLLLEAYGKAFTSKDSVCLIVKDMGGPALYEGVNARELIKEFTAVPSHPAVEYIDRSLSEEEMPALYAAADCLVHPYRGEGFGLPIAEAMASELPVIVTGAGAAMDFCTSETAFLVPARKGRLAARSIGGVETVDYPWLFEPDGEELVRLLQHVRKHRTEAKAKARAARKHVLSTLTWEKAEELVAGRILALSRTPVRRTAAATGTEAPPREPVPGTATRIHPRIEAALARVVELQLREQPAEAETILNALRKSLPSEPAVPLAYARFLMSTRQYERAAALITATPLELKTDPAWLEITAECLEGTGDLDGADSCAARILERSPRSVSALTLRGRLAAHRGDLLQAERYLREAAAIDPVAGDPRGLLGALLLRRGETAEGLSLLASGFALSPLNGDLLVTMVDAFREAGELARAAALVEDAARAFPSSKRLRYFLAELFAGLDRPDEALRTVLECLATFGVDDAGLAFALNLRLKTGPMDIPAGHTPGTSVSACMIIKDEERYLARCIWSLLPLVQEIIVIDTGSADRSEEIAAAFGAKVFRAPWTGDFSEARNRSLEPARGDWILILDGDEVFSAADQAAFRRLTSSPAGRTAWSFVTRNYLMPMNVIGWIANDGRYAEEAGTGWIPSEKTRLFPRGGSIRFENPVHELVERSLQESGITVSKSEIPIHHYGKLDAGRTREKAEVYLELGRKKLAESGNNDIKAMFELAFQENDLGNYEEALRLYRRIQELHPAIPKVHFAIGANLGTLKRYEEAVPSLERSISLDPKLKEAYVHLTLVHLALGNRVAALEAAERLHALGIEYPPGTALLAAARFVTGDVEGGRRALEPAQRRGMSFQPYFVEFARHLRSEGHPDFAVSILEPFVAGEETPQDLATLLVDCYRDLALAPDPQGQHV